MATDTLLEGHAGIEKRGENMKKVILLITCFLILIPEMGKAQDFNFYGVKFGMAKSEVERVFSIKSEYGLHEVKNPGHYMNSLFLGFDHKDRLFYAEVYYQLEGNERDEALRLAVKEAFEDPINKLYKDVEVKIDTYTDVSRYGKSKSLVMKLTSKSLRSEYISNLKREILGLMK